MPYVEDTSLPEALRAWPGIPLTEYTPPGGSDGPQRRDFVNDLPAGSGKGSNAAIWPIYNGKAEELDAELIETCNDAMDNLLIFAALFSAIVTAFLMLSLPLLQPDNSQAMVDGITALSAQIAVLRDSDISMPPIYQASAFMLSMTDVWVNALWLLSLMISLTTSVLAMLIKQWLRAFVTDLPSAPRNRAHHRQFRLDGVQIWHVPRIASSLPVLIHVAVGLFLAGLMIYLCNIALPLGIVLGTIFAAGSLGYFLLAAAPLFWLQCPYKSPLTEALDWLWSCLLRTSRSTLAASGIPVELPCPKKARVHARIDVLLTTKKNQFDDLCLSWLACTTSADIDVSRAVAMAYFNLNEFVMGETESRVAQAERNKSMRLLHLPQLQSPRIVLPRSATWSEVKEVLIQMAVARTFEFWETHETWSLRALHWAWSLPLDAIPESDRLLYYVLMLHCLGPRYSALEPQIYKLSLVWFKRASSYFLMDLRDPTRSLSSFACTLFLAFLDRCLNRQNWIYRQLVDVLCEPVADCIGASASLPASFLGWAAVIWGTRSPEIRAHLDPRTARTQHLSHDVESIRDSILIPLIASDVHGFLEKAAMRYAMNEMALGTPDCLGPTDGLRHILEWFRSHDTVYPQRLGHLETADHVSTMYPAEVQFLRFCVEAHSEQLGGWSIELVQACQLLDVRSDWWERYCPTGGRWWDADYVDELMHALAEVISSGRQFQDPQTIRIGLHLFPLFLKSAEYGTFKTTRTSSLKGQIDIWLGSLIDYGFVDVILQDEEGCDLLCKFLSDLLHGPDLWLADAVADSGLLHLLIQHKEHENLLGLANFSILRGDFVQLTRTRTTSSTASSSSVSTSEASRFGRGMNPMLMAAIDEGDMLEMGQLKGGAEEAGGSQRAAARRWRALPN